MQETAIIALSFSHSRIVPLFSILSIYRNEIPPLVLDEKVLSLPSPSFCREESFINSCTYLSRDRFNEHDGFNEARPFHRCRSLIIFDARCFMKVYSIFDKKNVSLNSIQNSIEKSSKRNCPLGLEIMRECKDTMPCRCIFENGKIILTHKSYFCTLYCML